MQRLDWADKQAFTHLHTLKLLELESGFVGAKAATMTTFQDGMDEMPEEQELAAIHQGS